MLKKFLGKLSASSLVLIVIGLVAIGYLGGTFNQQIVGFFGPLISGHGYIAPLDTSSLQQTYRLLEENYDGKIDPSKLIDGAKSGLVSALGDPYTVFMNQSDASNFNSELDGTISGGVGVEVQQRNNLPYVSSVVAGTPAEKAGMKGGDIITAINGKTTSTMSEDVAVAAIRGAAGTKVTLTVQRGSQSLNFTMTREPITAPSVTSSVDGSIGIITISRFDESTGTDAQAAAQKLKSAGVKGAILDLRNNGGGYVTSAQGVASIWLNNKTIATERVGNEVVDTYTADNDPILAGVPTVVLVNGNSASASEIVTGALKDYGVATIIGTQTFGKGSVQKIFDLPNGALLKVTVARWYTPKGVNINEKGITPDKVVDFTQAQLDAGQDPQLAAAKQALGQ